MPRPAVKEGPQDTREAILKVAGNLLQTRGYNGFSYAHVAQALNVKTAAIHYHFPAKTDLGLAVVERYRERYRRWMKDAQSLPAWEQLDGYFRIFEYFLSGNKTCPAGVLQAEYQAIPEELRAQTRDVEREVHAWLTQVLEQGRAHGAFVFTGEPSDKARLIGAGVQGALQVARPMGKDAFHAVLRALRADLGR
jgi:TetR/AcrR family transcriptional repressor of nem operon